MFGLNPMVIRRRQSARANHLFYWLLKSLASCLLLHLPSDVGYCKILRAADCWPSVPCGVFGDHCRIDSVPASPVSFPTDYLSSSSVHEIRMLLTYLGPFMLKIRRCREFPPPDLRSMLHAHSHSLISQPAHCSLIQHAPKCLRCS